MTSLQDAIAMVKAAGYTVSKKREKKLKTVGPTFVAHWVDGQVTRMSIHTMDEAPDLRRAVRVSFAAYMSRTKEEGLPLLKSGHFERNGEILFPHAYAGEDLQHYVPATIG